MRHCIHMLFIIMESLHLRHLGVPYILMIIDYQFIMDTRLFYEMFLIESNIEKKVLLTEFQAFKGQVDAKILYFVATFC